MEQLIIEHIKSEIDRFNEILELDDTDNLTLKEYKKRYAIIKDYLEQLLLDLQKVINNPVVRKKYEKED